MTTRKTKYPRQPTSEDRALRDLREQFKAMSVQLYNMQLNNPVHTPDEAAAILSAGLIQLHAEEFHVLNLNTRNKVIHVTELYTGTLNEAKIRIAEVFRDAILYGAASIIIAHNHPSGDPTPSPDDISLTRSIRSAGQLLEIDVLDHLIIGYDGRYQSLRSRGLGFD